MFLRETLFLQYISLENLYLDVKCLFCLSFYLDGVVTLMLRIMEYFCRFLKIQCASSFLWRNVIFAAVSTNVVFHQCIQSLHENKNFRLPKIYEKDRKDHIFISFPMFPFHGNIIFSQLSFKRKCKERASFRKCVFLHKCPSSAANVL